MVRLKTTATVTALRYADVIICKKLGGKHCGIDMRTNILNKMTFSEERGAENKPINQSINQSISQSNQMYFPAIIHVT